jgi:DNA-binding NtrC family response regulator
MEATLTRPLHLFVRGGKLSLDDGRSFDIGTETLTIGRDAACDVVVDDREVSALHAEVSAITEGVLVRDHGSTNGTFVGPVRVREAILVDHAVVTVGATRMTFVPSAKQRVDVGYTSRFGELVGASPKMRRVFQVLERIAPTELSVLVTGDTGTGKELVARAVHGASARKAGPLVVVDCGSIPASLAEGVLFGHEKGAFTGATSRRKGALAEAHGGTLFLDELGELPMELQPKLLRVLAERHVQRVGSNTPEPIDVRVVAATRRDLGREMNQGGFRSDLFFRIAQVRVELPSLRERASDLPLLVEAMCQKLGRPEATPVVRAWVAQHRAHHDWPGNVRELMNVVSVAAALFDDPAAIDDVLSVERLSREPPEPNAASPTTSYGQARQEALRAFELSYFKELHVASGGNVSEMARRAGMERHHVRAFLRKLGLRE